MCVAACAKGVLAWDGDQHPFLESRQKRMGISTIPLDTCSFCPVLCEASCPRLNRFTPLEVRSLTSARADGVIKAGEPNDVIRSLLVAGRVQGLIDGAVMLDLDPYSLRPVARVATTVDEIVASQGLHYLWAPVLGALNDAIFGLKLRRVAIVGMPCVAEAVRNLIESDVDRLRPYQGAIRFSIATFCTGVYLPDMVRGVLECEMGLTPEQVRHVTVSMREGRLRARLWDTHERSVPLTALEPYTRRGCATCVDFLGESADVAVGPVGAQAGWSTVIMRTTRGEMLVQHAIQSRLLSTLDNVDEAVLRQARDAKDGRERARAFDDFKLLMLDALGDPDKRAQVRRQFNWLYGTPRTTRRREALPYAGCGDCSGC